MRNARPPAGRPSYPRLGAQLRTPRRGGACTVDASSTAAETKKGLTRRKVGQLGGGDYECTVESNRVPWVRAAKS